MDTDKIPSGICVHPCSSVVSNKKEKDTLRLVFQRVARKVSLIFHFIFGCFGVALDRKEGYFFSSGFASFFSSAFTSFFSSGFASFFSVFSAFFSAFSSAFFSPIISAILDSIVSAQI